MKNLILLTAILASSVGASAKSSETCVTINELPYSEGTLYFSLEQDGKNIQMDAIEIESDSVSIATDLSKYDGKEIAIKAFQDLNGNQRLDMDTYGRPTEPCLQTTFTPTSDLSHYTFQLIQY